MSNLSKIHPNLARRIGVRAGGAAPEQLQIIVRFVEGVTDLETTIEGVEPTRAAFRLLSAAAFSSTRKGVEELSELDSVKMIWMDEPVHSAIDRPTDLICAEEAWQTGLTGRGIRVGIVDSGIDPQHPDLAGRIAQVKDLTGDGPLDSNGHGTASAGIIGGTGAASGGRLRGIAPECILLVAKVLHADGWSSTSAVMAGIDWAIQQKAQIINLSLGTESVSDGTDALSAMCDAATAKGVLVCAAAGNGGPGQSTIGSPGCAESVLTVGASDMLDQIASFSSRGPTGDGRSKPDVCAPGVNIICCRASGTSLGDVVDDGYTSCSGTSIATPFVAGVAALLLGSARELGPSQVKKILMESATRLNCDGTAQGSGRINIAAALQRLNGTDLPAPEPLQGAGPIPRRSGCLHVLRNILGGR